MKNYKYNLWAFDFDGTISHIVPDRNSAVLDPDCRDVLTSLANDHNQIVAVVSSRSLEDLRTRVSIKNVILAGGSGLEWWAPGGLRLGPNRVAKDRLIKTREKIFPALKAVGRIPGVEIEDKNWSAAIHFRKVADENLSIVAQELEDLHYNYNITLQYGPEVAEVQFLEEVNKKIAVKVLATLFGRRLTSARLIYSGDDQNDAQAMRWVLKKKGAAYIVGNQISIKNANVVADPTDLARALRDDFRYIFNTQCVRIERKI